MTNSQDPHGSAATVGPHGAEDHGDDLGHDDRAQGDSDALGPVNVLAWGAGAVGIIGGLAVGLLLAVAAGWFG